MCRFAQTKGETLETSGLESLYGGQFTLSTQLIKPNYFTTPPTDAAPQVNFNKSKYRVQSLTSMSPELCLTTKLHSLDLGRRYIQPNDCDL